MVAIGGFRFVRQRGFFAWSFVGVNFVTRWIYLLPPADAAVIGCPLSSTPVTRISGPG